MTTTTNLLLELVPGNTAQPEIIINQGLVQLDKAVAGMYTLNFTVDSNITIADADALNMILSFTDTGALLTVGRDVILPARPKAWIFHNGTAKTLTAKISGSTGVAITAGSRKLIYSTGLEIYAVA